MAHSRGLMSRFAWTPKSRCCTRTDRARWHEGPSRSVRFKLERERVLGADWMIAGRSKQVAESGDCLTYEGHGETVVHPSERWITRCAQQCLSALRYGNCR